MALTTKVILKPYGSPPLDVSRFFPEELPRVGDVLHFPRQQTVKVETVEIEFIEYDKPPPFTGWRMVTIHARRLGQPGVDEEKKPNT